MRSLHMLLLTLIAFLIALSPAAATQLTLVMPLERTAYQTNERIEIAVTRSSPQPLPAGVLTLTLTGVPDPADGATPGFVGAIGSRLTFTFPVADVPVVGNDASATETLYLNGWLLRPGRYAVEADYQDATAKTEITINSHIRESTFKTFSWGCQANGAEVERMGEDSLGFNMLFLNGVGDDTIRAGVDWMQTDYQGGGSQMDLRRECDWSDPNVIRGGAARLSRGAFIHRRQPNALGMHFYDEALLTNAKDPVTGVVTPNSVPAQLDDYTASFGEAMTPYNDIDPTKADDAEKWDAWARWKLSLFDANNELCRWAVQDVKPDFLATTQTQCWWMYFANGSYFNAGRSLSLICGHCWYDFGPPDYYSPGQFLEISRARATTDKDNWFLPTWFTFAPTTRLENYLAFMTDIQGVAVPPDATVQRPSSPDPGGLDQTEAIVEANKTMGRLGPIFNTMPITRPPVAMLYSLSSNIDRQLHDMSFNGNGDKQYYAMMYLYLAGKMIQNPFYTVLDEDVVDGTLAAHHKAVVIGGVDYLAPDVIAGLEAFARHGGLVLVSADCGVKINGAVVLKHTALHPEMDKVIALWKAGKYGDITNMMKIGDLFQQTTPLAAEIEEHLRQAGIAPVFTSDNRGIAAYRQAQGDIEYLFAANATPDIELGSRNALRAATATLGVPADGRPIYDVIHSRPATEFIKAGDTLRALLRFGPGQLRVFARTARPIGGIRALTPSVQCDLTRQDLPLSVRVGASLTDTRGGILAGAAPLEIWLTDPLGSVRYHLYRATTDGEWRDDLPLAANDPSGRWTVRVRELLAGTSATVNFALNSMPQCGALAGAAQRAISFGDDRDHIYRFFRTHRNVTIVKGAKDFYAEAAQRLAEILAPWGVQCTIVDAADVDKPLDLTAAQAKTWVGLDYAPSGSITAGANPPQVAGYAIQDPVILLGTPDDNPLINFLARYNFLPYSPQRDVIPGRGRGYLAWQRDGIAREQESITLIAYDAAGMSEAVGSLYEAATGLDPLTPWRLPASSEISPATSRPASLPQARVAWDIELPDRPVALAPFGAGRVAALTYDGTLCAVDAHGKVDWQQHVDMGHAWSHRMDVSADGNLVAVAGRMGLLAFDGNGALRFSAPRKVPDWTGHPVPRVTFVAVSPDGTHIADGAWNGVITVSDAKGKPQWTNPGWKADSEFFFQQALFSADSKELVSLTDKQATALNAATGKAIGTADGADCRFTATREGNAILLNDGNGRLSLFDPVHGKTSASLALPGVVAATDVTSSGVLAAMESDGSVRLLKSVSGAADDQTAWKFSIPQRLVKQVATGPEIAVSCWGGTVYLLDKAGKPLATRVFDQDIARMAWVDNLLVVGLADGRLMAISAK